MKIDLRPLHPSFGAEVVGVDVAQDLDEETIAAIPDAWTRHSLLLFRDVRMTQPSTWPSPGASVRSTSWSRSSSTYRRGRRSFTRVCVPDGD